MISGRLPLVLLAVVAASCGGREPPEQPAGGDSGTATEAPAAVAAVLEAGDAAAAAIAAEDIRAAVAELGDDRYEGRAPGTPGDELTQRYLTAALEALGFEPAFPNRSYRQPFELVGVSAAQPSVWTFATAGGAALELAQGADFIAASGVERERAAIDGAEVVFVGYGIEAPEHDWDDFKGADLAGKVLLMLNNDPDWDPELFGGVERLYYGRWTYKYESAARQGAAGAIIVHTTPSAGYPWQVVQSSWSGTQFRLPASGAPEIEVQAWVTDEAARRVTALGGHDLDALVEQARSRDFRPVPLGVTTSIVLENTLSRVETANVAGVLRGRDPQLADELVVYTAHHDHLGVGEPNPSGDPNDRIYNGARDNASGVGMVLAIGRAFRALPEPPRRSVMLLFVGAEEQGLLGALHFAANPPVPPGRIAANVNYDSGNIWGETRDITFIGLGKSSLDDVAAAIARREGRIVVGDQFPDRGLYYRSDQFAFAQIGVPAFYFSPGTDFVGRPDGWGREQAERYTNLHYHQPSDELGPEWSFAGMVQDARFGFLAGLLIAEADELPRWRPGDEFEAARERALEALR